MVVFHTPWFDLVSKELDGQPPHYSVRTLDYVNVFAQTMGGEVLLVRQYRPAVETHTLELPGGHVEQGEQPLDAARRELEEETGYRAGTIEIVGHLKSDTGRLGNRLWACWARDCVPMQPAPPGEPGVEFLSMPEPEFMRQIASGQFDPALNLAVVFLALLRRGAVAMIQS
jgi:ADP-ribose pyrophosphatase